MYLGSAAAMLALPPLAAAIGPAALPRAVGCLGLAWLALWLAFGRDVPHREALIPLTASDAKGHYPSGNGAGADNGGDDDGGGRQLLLALRSADSLNGGDALRARGALQQQNSQASPRHAPRHSGGASTAARGSQQQPHQHAARRAAGAAARAPPAPWRRMLRSPAVWAIVANNFAFHYAFYVVLNWLPTYFGAVLGEDLADLGAVRALPYLAMFATSNAGGWAGDWLAGARGWGVAAARKAVNTAGARALFWSLFAGEGTAA